MVDRQSENPGRVKITLDDGTVMYGTIERADGPTVVGTPLNKNTLFNSTNEVRYGCELPSQAFEAITREVVVRIAESQWSTEANEEGYFVAEIPVDGMKEEFSPVFAPDVSDALSAGDVEEDFSETLK